MAQCRHQCYRCKNYNGYYIINESKFEKTKYGYCMVTRETRNIRDGCEY